MAWQKPTIKKALDAPYRADLVGSLLRPAELKEAHAALAAGTKSPEDVAAIQKAAIQHIVDEQVRLGFKAVTDGEFSRRYWHLDFLWGLEGIDEIKHATYEHNFKGDINAAANVELTGPISYNPHHPFFKAYSELQSLLPEGVVAKQTIPSPILLFRDHRTDGWEKYYDSREELLDAIATAYGDTINQFYILGCRYLQIDDTNWAYLIQNLKDTQNDIAKHSEFVQLAHDAHDVIEEMLAMAPHDMVITSHICRGNFQSTYLFEGGYEYIVEFLQDLKYDGLFLEYDTERAGGFAPLETLWNHDQNKRIVLGLITSKFPELEDEAAIRAKIDAASQYVPLENLALSTQCGFASTEEGNKVTEADQWAKLALVQKIAGDVWSD
ncbi:5-methyltetrahydropteroyltriglutamate--homocysteine S-methyltransferase [Lacticaseibacillus mingshuiensis]|uniref:5-methyltetrahydropteroyltriglutamate--homocysteine S-methyltransferase n=1 Tax=Lacticaseibacillus mingshuiensis TaxID=2799574 RepID=A0ABW4CHQ0_9LACO|nr:5-methyltetrahydropteroyltriglutamate--homocysteine S-methyltransferase [Lacticaseibacillus mingshuiensis]